MAERKINARFLSDYDGMANTKPSPIDRSRPDGSPSLAQRKLIRGEKYEYAGPVTVCEPAKAGDERMLPESVFRTLRGAGRVEYVDPADASPADN